MFILFLRWEHSCIRSLVQERVTSLNPKNIIISIIKIFLRSITLGKLLECVYRALMVRRAVHWLFTARFADWRSPYPNRRENAPECEKRARGRQLTVKRVSRWILQCLPRLDVWFVSEWVWCVFGVCLVCLVCFGATWWLVCVWVVACDFGACLGVCRVIWCVCNLILVCVWLVTAPREREVLAASMFWRNAKNKYCPQYLTT